MKYSLAQLLKNRIVRDKIFDVIFSNNDKSEIDWDKEDIDFKFVVNGIEVPDALSKIDEINTIIEKIVENCENEVRAEAKIMMKEEYGELVNKFSKISNVLDDLSDEIENIMD